MPKSTLRELFWSAALIVAAVALLAAAVLREVKVVWNR